MTSIQYPTLDEFRERWGKEIKPQARAVKRYINKHGPKINLPMTGAVVFCALSFVGTGIYLLEHRHEVNPVPFLVILTALAGFGAWASWRLNSEHKPKQKEAERRIEEELIRPTLELLLPGFSYRRRGGMGLEVVRLSRFFRPDAELKEEDLFEGRLGATAVRCSELTIKTRKYISTRASHQSHGSGRFGKTNYRETKHDIRTGMFMEADFNKSFRSQVLVMPDLVEALLGEKGVKAQRMARTARKMFGGDLLDSLASASGLDKVLGGVLGESGSHGLEEIRMEDPEFEKYFQVFCEDPLEANYILTPSFMARLSSFRQGLDLPGKNPLAKLVNFHRSVHLSFRDSRMYLFFNSGRLFEFWDFDTLGRFEPYEKLYHQLKFAVDAVEELNLNTRVWGEKALEAARLRQKQDQPGAGPGDEGPGKT
ncbi:MAG: DUF3137 domain-containing protein [Deltaproteobacteria bacterium]|nr:DUF3137 domain-containing protein [Deltaproteobacteria bacterium]